jgi:hypothetical protein
MLKAKALPGYF